MRRDRPLSTSEASSVLATTWRPAWETGPVLVWTAALLFYAAIRPGISEGLTPDILAAISAVFLVKRLLTLLENLRDRASLSGYALRFGDLKTLREVLTQAYRNKSVYFGEGFIWTPECAQRTYELSKIDPRRLELPGFLARTIACHAVKPKSTIGLGYIHGLGDKEHPIFVPQKTLEGGTLIVGTTQAGKGVLLTLLISQAILRGDAVIVIDPKNSPRSFAAMKRAAKAAGRITPFYFHPSGSGIRMNPLEHFERISEVASRVTSILDETGPFAAFAWNAVHVAAGILVRTGHTVTLAGLLETLQNGMEELLIQAVTDCWGDTEFTVAFATARSPNLRDRLIRTFDLFETNVDLTDEPELKAAIAAYRHDPEHYSKIIASMIPLLTMLTAGSLRTVFSATEDDPSPAPIVNLQDVIERKAILYVATDALPDAKVSQAIGSLLIAELASIAGYRYNKRLTPTRVCLFIDECSAVMQPPLIEILNKGAEAGIETTCAMQTVSDLSARLGSDAAAQMALGNFNTLVCLRTRDPATAEFVSKNFGKTYIAMQEASLATQSDALSPQAFHAAQTQRLTSVREDRIPIEVLGSLPNTEYFASIAGGTLVKGRVPILVEDEKAVL